MKNKNLLITGAATRVGKAIALHFAEKGWNIALHYFQSSTKAKELNDKLMPLHKSLFVESSPSPVKYAASLLNLCSDEVRLPLVKIEEETKKAVKLAMKHANLI